MIAMKTVFKNSINSGRSDSSAFILLIFTKCYAIFASAFPVTIPHFLSQIYAQLFYNKHGSPWETKPCV